MTTCPKCGVELPPDTPVESCPNCILSFAVGDSDTVVQSTNDKTQFWLAAGKTFGDYELLEEIARGGMGVVYKARQKRLNRIVAVKMILTGQFAGKQIAQRFKSEAGAAAILQHPNIVAVHDVGVEEGQHFFSMDYVEGQNLAQLVGNNPLPPRKAANYVKQISEAIHHAHQQGILHRDLKPSNVLIDAATDRPRVADFGLAKRLDGESSITITGQVLGSPNFMPPEQASAHRGKVGRHSDVYGLGAILFYTVTARPPFQGATLETTIHEVLNTEPLSPRALNPSVPRDLETICLKCLQKDSSHRYPTAQELADELGRFLNDEPIHARPVSRTERAWRWCRRKPALAASFLIIIILFLIVIIGSPIAIVRINRARTEALKNEQKAINTARDLRQNLYVADINNALAEIQRGEFGSARARLERYGSNAPGEDDLRGIEWRFLWQQCQPEHEFSLGGHSNEVRCAVFSPDGSWLATAGLDRVVRVWNPKSRDRIRTLTGFDDFIDAKAMAFSPESKLLVAKGGHRLRAWRISDWSEVGAPLTVATNWNFNNAVAFSRDGLTLATRMPGGVGFVDVRRWQTNDLFLNGEGALGTVLTYSPDGRFLVLSDWEKLLIREAHSPLNIVTNLLRSDGNTAARVLAVAISESYLAAGFRDGVLALWDLKDWHEITSFKAHQSYLCDLAFSPDGKLLASCADEHAIRLWRMEELLKGPASGEPQPTLLRGHTRHVCSVMFAPDGPTLASSSNDRTAKLWNLSVPRAPANLPASSDPLWFSSDGKKLLVVHTNEQLHLWDVAAGLDLGQVAPALNSKQILAVSPDGELVVTKPQTNRLELRALSTGGLVRPLEMPGCDFQNARFAPKASGRRMVVATIESSTVKYWLWEVDSGQPPLQIGASSDTSARFALSSEGNWLAFFDANGAIQLYNAASRQSRMIPFGGENQETLAISPDSSTLAAVGYNTVRFWDVQSGHELEPLLIREFSANTAYFSSDGRTLITCNFDGDVRFWNIPLRKELMLVNSNVGDFRLLLSPDGSTLALPAPIAFAKRGKFRVWRAPTLVEIDRIESAKAAGNANLANKESE